MLVLKNKELIETTNLLSVNIYGRVLSNVSLYKYLGIEIDRNLPYTDVVHNNYLDADRKLFTLRKTRS